MKSLLFTTAVLTASTIPALAKRPEHRPGPKAFQKHAWTKHDAPEKSCDFNDDLCPACDGGNVTDVGGHDWAVSCGWSIASEEEEFVEGDNSPEICVDACDEADDCWAVNMAANGSCKLVTGDPRGLSRQPGSTALVRLPDSDDEPDDEPDATSSSRVQITATIYGPGVTRTSRVSITSTTEASPTASSSGECNLRLNNLCPQCDGTQVDSEEGIAYRIHCDQDLYSNSSYSPQEWMSPAECLAECDKYDWCEGTMYYDERSCELARGENVFPTSKADYTAFLPVATGIVTPTVPSAYRPPVYTPSSSSAEPVFSILPIDPGCDLDALTCPACDGMPYVDKLNASYTVVCGVEPDCVSISKFREPAEDQEMCLQSCDQDVTCLGAMWYPESSACHSCRQGMELDDRASGRLSYVLLVADIDGDDDDNTTTSTTTRRSTVYPGTTPTFTLVPPTSRSITDLPAPFSTSTANGPGPVGPVIVSAIPSANPGGPLINITSMSTTTTSKTRAPPAPISSSALISCPASNNSVYSVPENNEVFAVGCGLMLTAAHSRYTTATDIEACAASCTGQCDGIQFGYSTRCGLYTDYSVVGPADGWTIAARITHTFSAIATPTAVATTSQHRFSNSTAA